MTSNDEILSRVFESRTFLTHHSLEKFEIQSGSHLNEELIENRQYTL